MAAPSRLDPARSAGYLTNWAARLFARAMDERLRPLGLSSGQLPVFFALAGGRALSQKELAQAAAIEQPTMAATLARMERDGLILRTPDPKDRRSARITLTDLAHGRIGEVTAAVEAINAQALSGLAEAEVEGYRKALLAVIGNLERTAGGS